MESFLKFILDNVIIISVLIIVIVLGVYFFVFSSKLKEKRYKKWMKIIAPLTYDFIKDDYVMRSIKKVLSSDYKKILAVDIMMKYTQNTGKKLSEKYKMLGLDKFIMCRVKNKHHINDVKRLAYLQSEDAYPLLINLTSCNDSEIVYVAFFGIIMLELTKSQQLYVFELLLKAKIHFNRIVEHIAKLKISIDDLIEKLKNSSDIRSKAIIIKAIINRNEMISDKNAKVLLGFFYDAKLVCMAAMEAISKTKDSKYIPYLYDAFKNHTDWEIRVIAVKCLANFPLEDILPVMSEIVQDDNWWVKNNTVKALAKGGRLGIDALKQIIEETKSTTLANMTDYYIQELEQ